MEMHFPRTSRSSNLPSILPSVGATSFRLVVAFKIIHRQPFKAVVYFIYFSFLSLNSTPQTMGRCPSRAPCPAHLRSNTPPYCFPQLLGWLLFKLPKQRPPKARARRISLFFCAPYSDAPINRTGNAKSAPNALRLLQTHREQWRQDIGPWLMLPWRERTKAAGG